MDTMTIPAEPTHLDDSARIFGAEGLTTGTRTIIIPVFEGFIVLVTKPGQPEGWAFFATSIDEVLSVRWPNAQEFTRDYVKGWAKKSAPLGSFEGIVEYWGRTPVKALGLGSERPPA